MLLRDFDWQAEAFARGWAVTHPEPERKPPKAPLPEGLTKKACRTLMRGRVRAVTALPASRSSVKAFELLHRRCDGCRRCAVPPA
jgi:hypothetical protein